MPQLIKDRRDRRGRAGRCCAMRRRSPIVPADAPVIVPLALWRARARRACRAAATSASGSSPTTIPTRSRDDVARAAADRGRFPEVHRRSRLFDRAGCCATAIGFGGELRAIGDVLRDQLYYLRACGFDAFALRADRDARRRARAPSTISATTTRATVGAAGAAVPPPRDRAAARRA